jgi:hypothetical protein
MRWIRRLFPALLVTTLAAGCGGSDQDGLLVFGQSFTFGPNPAQLTIAAGESATVQLELSCVFNQPTIAIEVTNVDELERTQILLLRRQPYARRFDLHGCPDSTGQRNASGQALYHGTVAWSLTALDTAPPGQYRVEFLAETLQQGVANAERATLLLVVTAPHAGRFSLSTPADAQVNDLEQPPLPPRFEARIPIALQRDGFDGPVALAATGIVDGGDPVPIDPVERFTVALPAQIAAGASDASADVRYQLSSRPAAGDRVIVTAVGDGVSRSQVVRLRGDSLRPLAPLNLTASATTAAVTLRWDADRGATAYRIERAPSETSPYATLATVDATTISYQDAAVQPATRYVYRVYAVNAHGSSAPAQLAVLTTSLPVLTVTVQGRGTVQSDPAGIDCGSSCTMAFAEGAVVRLIAIPAADHLSSFAGEADCSDGVVTMSRSIACVVSFVPRAGSGWQQLGGALAMADATGPAFSLAIDDDRFGEPVVAYVESATPAGPARLFVTRRNGAAWETLGGGALNPTSLTAASDPSLATRLTTPIHVAWSQGNGVQQNVFVARLNGAAWESVGPPGIPLNYVAGSRAVRPAIALSSEGLPQVAWIEDGVVKWKRFDGANWVASAFGPEGPASGNADRVRLATSPSTPVIAWTEGPVNDRKLKVVAGQSFAPFAAQVNAPFDVPVTITHFGLRPDGSGALVFWTQDELPFSVFARRWQDGPWEEYGAPPLPADSSRLLSFAVARRSVDVAFSLQPPASQAFVTVLQRSGSDWYRFPALETTGGTLRNLEVEAPRNDSPIVAGTFSSDGRTELRVYRYFP